MYDTEMIVATEKPDLVDEVSDTLFYMGWADIGADVATLTAAKFRIVKMEKGAGSPTVWTRLYAGSTDLYTQIWANRASLIYNFKK